MADCSVCDRISLIKNNKNRYFVKEMESGYVVLCDYQYFYGYTIFLSKIHTDELHKLGNKKRELFLREMAIVAEAVIKAFKPKKLNYELLGNSDSHLHWHLIPRYGKDSKPNTAIWTIESQIRCNEKTKPSKQKLEKLKQKLLEELDKLS
ncbi:MAG TPA: HIT family protein [Candidatus Woesebacteria bacterium]|nr:HIT family protein [Candidatus Woesebacteria bacterium]